MSNVRKTIAREWCSGRTGNVTDYFESFCACLFLHLRLDHVSSRDLYYLSAQQCTEQLQGQSCVHIMR